MVLDMRQDLIMEGIRVGKCQPVGRLSPKVEVPAGAEAITPATRSCTGEIIWASESLLLFQFWAQFTFSILFWFTWLIMDLIGYLWMSTEKMQKNTFTKAICHESAHGDWQGSTCAGVTGASSNWLQFFNWIDCTCHGIALCFFQAWRLLLLCTEHNTSISKKFSFYWHVHCYLYCYMPWCTEILQITIITISRNYI